MRIAEADRVYLLKASPANEQKFKGVLSLKASLGLPSRPSQTSPANEQKYKGVLSLQASLGQPSQAALNLRWVKCLPTS